MCEWCENRLRALDYTTRTRTSCSVILIAGNWAFLLIKKCQNCYRVVDLFWFDDIFAKPCTKMTTASRFFRQNDAGLRAHVDLVGWNPRNSDGNNSILMKTKSYLHSTLLLPLYGWFTSNISDFFPGASLPLRWGKVGDKASQPSFWN